MKFINCNCLKGVGHWEGCPEYISDAVNNADLEFAAGGLEVKLPIMLSHDNNFQTMKEEHAQTIKALRTSGCTWGRIAELIFVICGNQQETWGQMAGKDLCHRAAEILGEDDTSEDWN